MVTDGVLPSPKVIFIRRAHSEDAPTVASILLEASRWAEQQGSDMWTPDEIAVEVIQPDVDAGLFYLAVDDGEARGTLKFILEDPEFWPDHLIGESAFIHRLAVRRRFAGTGVSTAMLEWAAGRARDLGRTYLRLDCDPRRARLRAFYERQGFSHHDDFRSRRFLVSRYQMTL